MEVLDMNLLGKGLRNGVLSDEAQIRELFDRYILTIVAHDAEGWMELWDENGIQLSPHQPMHVGKTAIREANFAFFRDPSLMWDFAIDTQEVLVFAEGYALARGLFYYTITPDDGGTPIVMDGKFMTVFRKQANGRWLLYRDCFNSNAPLS